MGTEAARSIAANMSPLVTRPSLPEPGTVAASTPLSAASLRTDGVSGMSLAALLFGSASAFGGTVWWEPLGGFGPGPSDIENHESLVTRLGTSTAISREANQGFGDATITNPEDTIVRLSNGTPLFRPGALGPGVVLSATNIQLWAIDAGINAFAAARFSARLTTSPARRARYSRSAYSFAVNSI